MTNSIMSLNPDALSNLLSDPVIVKLVIVVNLASLSILELLEYGFTRKDIGRGISKGIVDFERPLEAVGNAAIAVDILEAEQYLPEVLNSKVRLTELGLYMLEVIDGSDQQRSRMVIDDIQASARENIASELSTPSPHHFSGLAVHNDWK